jgi:hypothetical protein
MSRENVETVRAVESVMADDRVPKTRVLGGSAGATVPVTALVRAVGDQLGRRDGSLVTEVDRAVKQLGGQRTNYADTAGYLWKLRRFFGQSADRPEDVYVLPHRVVGPSWGPHP